MAICSKPYISHCATFLPMKTDFMKYLHRSKILKEKYLPASSTTNWKSLDSIKKTTNTTHNVTEKSPTKARLEKITLVSRNPSLALWHFWTHKLRKIFWLQLFMSARNHVGDPILNSIAQPKLEAKNKQNLSPTSGRLRSSWFCW